MSQLPPEQPQSTPQRYAPYSPYGQQSFSNVADLFCPCKRIPYPLLEIADRYYIVVQPTIETLPLVVLAN